MLIPFDALVREHGIKPGPVLHVGAHLGEEARAYRAFGFSPVWWIEANPKVVKELASNVRGFPDNKVVRALLLDREREVTFHVASNGQSSSVLQLGTHAKEHPEVSYVDEFSLWATTVDALAEAKAIGQATFVNVDVQGAELDVLKGAANYLEAVQAVYTEVNVDELYEGCALLPEMDAWLDASGFRRAAMKLTGHGWGDSLYVRR